MYVFHYFIFPFCIKFCQVFWGGGQAPQARVSSPPGGRGQAAQGEGHTPGYLHPGGETNCTKAASFPVWGGGEEQATQDSR